MKIALCDDDRFTLQLTRELIEQAALRCGVQAQIVCLAASGEELRRFVRRSPGEVDLCFLDYDFGASQLNGIDIVFQLQALEEPLRVVFVTSHADKGMEILRSGARAFGFIEKDVRRERMISQYARYLRMASDMGGTKEPEGPGIELPIGIDETVRIALADLLYVEADKACAHTLCYHTLNGSCVRVRGTLEQAMSLLGANFVRSHRSVVVNVRHVIGQEDGLLRLTDGSCVVCSLGRRKEVLRACREGRANT